MPGYLQHHHMALPIVGPLSFLIYKATGGVLVSATHKTVLIYCWIYLSLFATWVLVGATIGLALDMAKNLAPTPLRWIAPPTLAIALVGLGAYQLWRTPRAIVRAIAKADKLSVCEMKESGRPMVLEMKRTENCITLDANDAKTILNLTRQRILADPWKRHVEGICMDFVTPDSQIELSGSGGDVSIQVNNDRCWMRINHALGSVLISNPEMVKRMPNFPDVQRKASEKKG